MKPETMLMPIFLLGLIMGVVIGRYQSIGTISRQVKHVLMYHDQDVEALKLYIDAAMEGRDVIAADEVTSGPVGKTSRWPHND